MAEHGHGGGGALKEFFIALGLDADSAAFASAEAMVDGLEKGLEVLVDVAEEAGKFLVELVEGTIKYGDEVDRTSKVLGIAAETIQQLNFAANISNVSAEALQVGFIHLARAATEVKDGSTEAAAAFGKLGVNVFNAKGQLKDGNQLLEDVADGIRKLPTSTERAGAAMQVFGKSGAQLVPLLMRGKEGIRELREEADALGIVLDESQIEAAAAAEENLKRLRSVGQSIQREFAGPLIEALNPVLEAALAWVKANRELINTKVREWANRLVDSVQRLASWLATIGRALNENGEAWDTLSGTMKVIVGVLEGVGFIVQGVVTLFRDLGDTAKTAAVIAFGAWLISLGPLALVAAGVVLALLAVQDFVYFLQGKDSLIGRIFQGWAREAMNLATTLRRLFDTMLPPWAQKLVEKQLANPIDVGVDIAGGKTSLPGPTYNALHNAAGTVPGGQFLMDRFFTGPGGTTSTPPGSGRQNVQATSNFTINASPTQSPKEIADEVDKRQREFIDSLVRGTLYSGSGG